jgi:hypothetical protein
MSSMVIFEKNNVVAEWHKGGTYTIKGPHGMIHNAADRDRAMQIAETMTHALGVEQLRALPIGTAVRLPLGADAYPDFVFTEALDGVVSGVEPDCVWISIAVHKPELDEWDNQIQVWFWDQPEGHEMPSQVVTLKA